MSKLNLLAFVPIVFALAVMVAGCSNPPAEQPDTTPDNAAATDHQGHEGHMDHGDDGMGENHSAHQDDAGHGPYEEALAKLPPEDHQLAENQKTCPVSGEPLGSMGTPHKVTVQGRDVLLCCPGCESKIKENPEEYLAKLPK